MLEGPRSYFTDLDPFDNNVDREAALRSLKLQLLTKRWVVIAASSLFHQDWAEVIKKHEGLLRALQEGIVIPAVRSNFGGINGFFDEKSGYGINERSFYEESTSTIMLWDLEFNSSWFNDRIFEAIENPSSVLRKRYEIDDSQAAILKERLIDTIQNEPKESQFIQRNHLKNISTDLDEIIGNGLMAYGNVIYRISGARTVDSEGHFPQSNLTNINISGNDQTLREDAIFWDIYVEAVFSHINTAIQMTRDRLDRLSFQDIMNIRDGLLSVGFCDDYDNLLKNVKNAPD